MCTNQLQGIFLKLEKKYPEFALDMWLSFFDFEILEKF